MNHYPLASASHQHNTSSWLHRNACHQLMGMLCFLLGGSDRLRLGCLFRTQPLINCCSFFRIPALKFFGNHGDSQRECKHSDAFQSCFLPPSLQLFKACYSILLVEGGYSLLRPLAHLLQCSCIFHGIPFRNIFVSGTASSRNQPPCQGRECHRCRARITSRQMPAPSP